MSAAVESWPAPIALGSRLCWFYDDRNWTIPVVSVESLYTDERRHDINNGWHAHLPTENGTHVDLTYDPHSPEYVQWDKGETQVHQWLYVPHPEYGYDIGARVVGDTIVYDPSCVGAHCSGCDHDFGAWWEYVSSPEQVLANLAWLGSLPIKVAP